MSNLAKSEDDDEPRYILIIYSIYITNLKSKTNGTTCSSLESFSIILNDSFLLLFDFCL